MSMNPTARELRQLRRAVIMLQNELRSDHLDEQLLADIETMMDHGIATAPGCEALVTRVDQLRESTLTPRPELYRDAALACERLKDAIEVILE